MRGGSPAPGLFSAGLDNGDNGSYGHFIPGFQMNDDAKSIRTVASGGGRRNESASKVIRRLRGQGIVLYFTVCSYRV